MRTSQLTACSYLKQNMTIVLCNLIIKLTVKNCQNHLFICYSHAYICGTP